MIVVDTDILIDAGRRIDEAVTCLKKLEQSRPLAVSSVTQMELIIGCRNKGELHSLDRFMSRFQIIKIDQQITDITITLLKKYRLSHGLLIADALIAATAIKSAVSLITKNQRDYRFVKGLLLLPYPG